MITRKPTSKAQTTKPPSTRHVENLPFKLRRASFKGKGLQAEFEGANWRQLRDVADRDPLLAKS
jgi:hypothetical protein